MPKKVFSNHCVVSQFHQNVTIKNEKTQRKWCQTIWIVGNWSHPMDVCYFLPLEGIPTLCTRQPLQRECEEVAGVDDRGNWTVYNTATDSQVNFQNHWTPNVNLTNYLTKNDTLVSLRKMHRECTETIAMPSEAISKVFIHKAICFLKELVQFISVLR